MAGWWRHVISKLGLRTILRLEARGSGSQESIKALAAVFNVDADTLFWRDGAYQAYKHKQWGFVTFAGIPLLAALVLIIDQAVITLPAANIPPVQSVTDTALWRLNELIISNRSTNSIYSA